MSVARGFPNAGHYYSNIVKPIAISCNFVVDPANGNGLGIRSLKSNGYISGVYMHTTATPAAANPNPAPGVALIVMKQNFNVYLGGFVGFVSPTTGGVLTSVTAHTAYIIASLGTTTLAQWNAVGFPLGFIPAVGAAFIATATGAIGGTGSVILPGASGNSIVEVVGDPNQTINNLNIAQYMGAELIVQFLAPTSASVTTVVQTAPATGSTVGMEFDFDGSSVTVDGL